MKTKKKGYQVLLILTILLTLCAVFTIVPTDHVDKVSMLGYKAGCSYAPISTIVCLLLAGISCKIRKAKFVEIK